MAMVVNGAVLAAVLAPGVHFEPGGDVPMVDYLVRRIGHGGKQKREPEDYGGAAAAARTMPRRTAESYAASTPQSCSVVAPPQPCPAAALHAPQPQRAPCSTTVTESYIVPPLLPRAPCAATALHALPLQRPPCPAVTLESYVMQPASAVTVVKDPSVLTWNMDDLLQELGLVTEASAKGSYTKADDHHPQSSVLPWKRTTFSNHLETIFEAEEEDAAEDDEETMQWDLEMPEDIEEDD